VLVRGRAGFLNAGARRGLSALLTCRARPAATRAPRARGRRLWSPASCRCRSVTRPG